MNKKCMIGAALASVAIALSSCGGSADTSSMAALIQSRDYAPITVEQKDIELTTNYSATIRGRQDIDVYPQVGGTLTQLCVTEGQRVSRGQTLFIIDQVPYKAAVAAAQAALAQAKAGVENAKAALEGSKAQLESAQAGFETAQATLAQARAGQQAALATRQSAVANQSTAQLTYDSRKTLFDQKIVSSYDLQTAHNSLLNAKAAVAQADAQVAQSNAQVAQANAQVSQAKGSIAASKAAISQCEAQIQSGYASIDQCNAQLVNAQNNLSYTVVKSPADGVVGELPYRQGALVSSNMPQPLTTVSDNNAMFVYFSINENDLLKLVREYGNAESAVNNLPAVKLTLADGSTYEYEGRVESVSGVINKSTGTSQLRAVFPNPNHELHSGNTGNIVMPNVMKNVIVIPQSATVKQQDKYVVYKVQGNIARPQLIEIELQNDGKNYIVKSGLTAGDRIIGQGVGLLHGDSININAATDAKKKLGVDKMK